MQVSGEDGDFPYGNWTVPYRTPAGREAILAAHGERFDLLVGRRTYDHPRLGALCHPLVKQT